MNDAPQPPYDAEDRRKHLDHVQAIVTRLAQGSNSAKGFSLTIAAAAFGFAALNQAWYLSLLGLAVILSFSLLDMHYLYQERLFRCLYREIGNRNVTHFAMDKDAYKPQHSRWDTYFSWSVLGFYAPLMFTGLVVVVIALHTDAPAADPPSPSVSDGIRP